jgi:hypothetical protein
MKPDTKEQTSAVVNSRIFSEPEVVDCCRSINSLSFALSRSGKGGMEWIDLAQYRGGCWRAGKCGNEPSGSIKCWEFLDWLKNCQLLSRDFAPWSE